MLFNKPMRLSTDIDIIVEPGVDVDAYIREAGKIFPFFDSEEDIRIGRNNIEKRHYKFLYESQLSGRSLNILLDVLFEENPYSSLVERPIKNSLLLTAGEDITVKVPGINYILGDKLTAFAPHTTGIPFGVGKELEVMKQMYDCWTLFQGMDDFKEVEKVYKNVVEKELAYRALDLQPQAVLSDTVRSCICLMGRGSIGRDEYHLYADGINRIQGHIFSGVFNGENAGIHSCSILYLVASMLYGRGTCSRIERVDEYQDVALKIKNARRITYIKHIDPTAYAYLVEAYNMLGDEYFVLE